MRSSVILFMLVIAVAASAGTGVVRAGGECPAGYMVEFGWFVPTAPGFGTHTYIPDELRVTRGWQNWIHQGTLGDTYERFVVIFRRGIYDILFDVDANSVITARDFLGLLERWRRVPAIWGNYQRLYNYPKADVGIVFPPGSCVQLTWPDGFVDPKVNLFNACRGPDGTLAAIGLKGAQWSGPAVTATSPCVGEIR